MLLLKSKHVVEAFQLFCPPRLASF